MPHSRIALKTGMYSPWVSRLLSGLGHEAIVAHARNVRLIGKSRRKNDRFDARTLARLRARRKAGRGSNRHARYGDVWPNRP
jgi:transposase